MPEENKLNTCPNKLDSSPAYWYYSSIETKHTNGIKIMLNVNIEIIENTKYYSTVDARGNSTMVFVWGDDMYVQTNNSPARHVEDVKRLSKAAKALIEFAEAEEAKEEEVKEEVIKVATNPRYVAFVEAHGEQPIYEFMAFIGRMKVMFCGEFYGSIQDHDGFTLFIKNNAHKYEVK